MDPVRACMPHLRRERPAVLPYQRSHQLPWYGIAGLRLRKRQVTIVSEPSVTPVPDLFRRDFTACEPNTK